MKAKPSPFPPIVFGPCFNRFPPEKGLLEKDRYSRSCHVSRDANGLGILAPNPEQDEISHGRVEFSDGLVVDEITVKA